LTPTPVYLDHAATSPLLPAAAAAMAQGFAQWANPSSPHRPGRAARALLEQARARIAAALGWPGEVILTSGASEALAIALTRAKAPRRVISAVEHDAVLRVVPEAALLPISAGGPDPAALAAALADPAPALVAVQHTNSETGTRVLTRALIEQVHGAGGLVLCDAAQIGPARVLPDGADMVVLSGHKLGGPVGIGALLVRDYALLHPSGGQERGYRGGTENLPGALALAAALEQGPAAWQTTEAQRQAFRAELAPLADCVAPGEQASHIVALASPRHSAHSLLIRLDGLGIAVSAGSACSSGSLKPSRVLAGFGIDPDRAKRTIRVSIGWSTTPDDLAAFVAAWQGLHG